MMCVLHKAREKTGVLNVRHLVYCSVGNGETWKALEEGSNMASVVC